MKVMFEAEKYERDITPIKLADALIDSGQFDCVDLDCIADILKAHVNYINNKELLDSSIGRCEC